MTADGRPVVVLTSTFPARAGDGTPGFVLTLCEALARHRPVTVVAPRVPGGPRHEWINGVEVVRFRYFPRRWEGLATDAIMPTLRAEPWRILEVAPFLVAYLCTTLRTVRRVRPALVNAHWVLPAGVVAWVTRLIAGTPYVLTAHGADAFVLTGRAARRLKRAVLARAALVLPVSEDIAGALRPLGAQIPAVVPMGVDVTAIRAGIGTREPEPGRFLFVGRLAGKKGVPTLLEALSRTTGGRVVIVGDGPDRVALEGLVDRLGIQDRVQLRGQQPASEVLRELRCAVALVVPSVVDANGDKDGTPVVLAEALAAGVPVIASDLAGLGEHLTDGTTGILVPPGDVAALGRALQRALDEPQRLDAIARAGARLADERFSSDSSAAEYERCFEAAIP